jgi:hypothetical protein
MKKFVTLSFVAAAALTVAACGSDNSANTTTTIDNETVLNSEDAPVDNLAVDDSAFGNASENAIDTGSENATLGDVNSSVELNDTTTNTAQ